MKKQAAINEHLQVQTELHQEEQIQDGQDEQHEGEQQIQDELSMEGQNIEGDQQIADAQEVAEEYQSKLSNKGVCYISRIPPYMKPNYIRKLLASYGVERIYLLPESQWTRKNRIRKGGNKKICFREGWVQFTDKRMAKLAALTLNAQKMIHKKGSFYSEDIWNLKYLAKFKWHNLTERLAHEERLKRERLKVELEQEKKIQDFYSEKISRSNIVNGIIKRKEKKGIASHELGKREFNQEQLVRDIQDE